MEWHGCHIAARIVLERNNLSRARRTGRQPPIRSAIRALPDQRKKPIHDEFHARDRRRDYPDYDQKQADKG